MINIDYCDIVVAIMAELNNSIDIRAPRELVWERAMDELFAGIDRSGFQVVNDGETPDDEYESIKEGTRLKGLVNCLGRKASIDSQVVAFEEYERIAVDLDVDRSETPFKLKAARLAIESLDHDRSADVTVVTSKLELEPASRAANLALRPITSVAGNQMQKTLEHLRDSTEQDYRLAG